MRRVAALCVLVVAVLALAETVLAVDSDTFIGDVERSIPGLLNRYETPSAGVAVVEDSRVTWEHRFDGDAGLSDRDVFKVASLSKTATSLAVLSLVEQGRVDLDAPIDEYVERWHVPRSRFDASGVTPRRLLSHTAGFPLSGGSGARRPNRYPPVEDILNGKHGLAAAELEWEPGTTFKYSNPGYVVLELLVEEVTGKSFSDAMRELVFEPLDMKDSGYQDDRDLVARDVSGYFRTGRPAHELVQVPRAPGGMLSTPSDIARLLTAAIRPKEDGGLLETETLEEMHTVPNESRGAFGVGNDGGYALGVAVVDLPSGRKLVANNGSFDGYNTMLAGIPEGRSGFVVLTNASSGLGIELEILLKWLDVVGGESPKIAGRLTTARTALRFGTLALLVLCLAYLVVLGRRVTNGRRAWPGRIRLLPLLLKTLPLSAIAAVLFLVLATGRLTEMLGGIPPARFISGDYQWIVTALAASLVAAAGAAVALPKKAV